MIDGKFITEVYLPKLDDSELKGRIEKVKREMQKVGIL